MKRILACIDFSETTAPVTAMAKTLSRALQAEVVVLFVVPLDMGMVLADAAPQPMVVPTPVDMTQYRRLVQEQVAQIAAEGIACRGLCLQGAVAATIQEQAKAVGADLIVLGSHGHGRVYHLLVGSVTQGVLRKSPLPILVVPSPRGPESKT